MNNNSILARYADEMTSNTYKVLKILYLNQAKLASGEIVIPLTQQNIADEMSLSLISVNAIFRELMKNDLVVITSAHSAFDYEMISKNATAIFDTRNAMKNIENRENIELL